MKKIFLFMFYTSFCLHSSPEIHIKIKKIDRLTNIYLDGEKIEKSSFNRKSVDFIIESFSDEVNKWDLTDGCHTLELMQFLDDGRMYYFKVEGCEDENASVYFNLKNPKMKLISSEEYYYKKALDLNGYYAYLRRFPYGNYSKEIIEKKKLIYKEKMEKNPKNTDFILAYLYEFPNSQETEELLNKYIELGANLNSLKLADNMVFVEGGKLHIVSTEMENKVYGDIIKSEAIIYDTNIGNFAIGKYEVSQEEFTKMMGYNPSKFKKKNRPVEQVTWEEAIKFCNTLSRKNGFKPAYDEESGDLLDKNGNKTTNIREVEGYRLPTEAEWEYAAKGGIKSENYRFIGSDYVDEVSWSSSNKKTKTVGLLKANELGIYDMGGNVFEWCNDYYEYNDYSHYLYSNPYYSKKTEKRSLRGGSYQLFSSNCTASNRGGTYPYWKLDYIGFRIGRSL